MIPRRRLLLASGLGILAAARVSLSQEQTRVRRIGFLAPLSRSTASRPDVFYDAFVQGMRELGYVEGKNLVIEWRFADGNFERLPALAAELVRTKVELIVTHSTPAIRALQKETTIIPIVFAVAIDPVRGGFADSLARPGGNITGLSVIDVDPSPKRLELLKDMVPALSRVAVLVNPGTSAHAAVVKSVQAAALQAGVKALPVDARTPEDIERAFAAMAREHAEGAIIADDAFFRGQRQQIAELAITSPTPSGGRRPTWTGSLGAQGLASCRSSSPPPSISPSTAGPRRPSA